MMTPTTTTVVDREGWRATLLSPNGLDKEGEAHLMLSDGRQLSLPSDMLEEQENGNYYLPLSLNKLAGLSLPETAAEQVIPVIEERLSVEKRLVERQRIQLAKLVHEREHIVDEPLLQEELEIKRVPMDVYVEQPLTTRYEGDTMIIPLFEEVLVVQKRLLLKEELHITKRKQEIRNPQTVILRSEEILMKKMAVESKQ